MKNMTLYSLIRPCVTAFAVWLTCVAFPARALTTNDLGAQHSVKVLTQHGYLPGIPVLVRVELRNAAGPERELWNADATLSADDPGVTLSTNRLFLRNGLGSALVAIRGGTDFNLTATVGALHAMRSLVSLTNVAVTDVGGSLAGSNVWSGIIRVTNDVTVPAGASLTLLSNTLVLFDGVTSGTTANDLLINGEIESIGTENDPITITCNSTNMTYRWGQIRHNTSQPSLYRHTSITRGGRGTGEGHTGTCPVIRSTNSRLVFQNCNLTDYAEQTRGMPGFGTPGKIAQATSSDLTFIDCLFQRARMGPEISGTALACTNTWIMDMPGPDDADGIYLHDQSVGQLVTLSGCVIADGDDDGIDTLGSDIAVEDCIIRDWDNLSEDAKGISIFNGATAVRRSLIVDSTVGIAAKWSSGAPTLVTIDHCTLTENLTNVWANRKDNAPGPFIDYRISNSVLWGGDPVLSDFGSTNFTIEYCNLSEPWPGTGNLLSDPLFVDAAVHDYHLQPYSPCIDSGNPAWPLDADGSRTDLGGFTFGPPAPVLGPELELPDGSIQFTLRAYTNRNWVVEGSTNLASWEHFGTIFVTTPTTMVTDTNAGTFPQRYFKAHLAP
jgi:hypothetical protein